MSAIRLRGAFLGSFVRRRPLLAAVAAVVAQLVATAMGGPTAFACSLADNAYAVDAAEQGLDTLPPGAPTIGAVSIRRGRGSGGLGCGGAVTSCDDLGLISFSATAPDDRTSAAMMGFRLAVTRGQAPAGLLDRGPDFRIFDGVVSLNWGDGNTDDQEALDFELDVRAIDRAGNVSATGVLVAIRDGGGGCRLLGGHAGSRAAIVCALLALGIAMRRRRRGRDGLVGAD